MPTFVSPRHAAVTWCSCTFAASSALRSICRIVRREGLLQLLSIVPVAALHQVRNTCGKRVLETSRRDLELRMTNQPCWSQASRSRTLSQKSVWHAAICWKNIATQIEADSNKVVRLYCYTRFLLTPIFFRSCMMLACCVLSCLVWFCFIVLCCCTLTPEKTWQTQEAHKSSLRPPNWSRWAWPLWPVSPMVEKCIEMAWNGHGSTLG